LEADRIGDVLEIYDRELDPDQIDHAPAKLVNGASLLWRLYLRGVDVGERFARAATAWLPVVSLPCLAFNDVHALMCCAGAGDRASAIALISDREKYVADQSGAGGETHNVSVTRDVGIPLCKALVAFCDERYKDVVDFLLPIREVMHGFGGSEPQRDVVEQTLIEASIRSNERHVASHILEGRTTRRPNSPFNWTKNGELALAEGDVAKARTLFGRAQTLAEGYSVYG